MLKSCVFFVVCVLALGCQNAESEQVTNESSLSASTLCASPGMYVGQSVRLKSTDIKLGALNCTQAACDTGNDQDMGMGSDMGTNSESKGCCNVCSKTAYVVNCQNGTSIELKPADDLDLPTVSAKVDPDHDPVNMSFVMDDPSFQTKLGCTGQACFLQCSPKLDDTKWMEGTVLQDASGVYRLSVSGVQAM